MSATCVANSVLGTRYVYVWPLTVSWTYAPAGMLVCYRGKNVWVCYSRPAMMVWYGA
jgi:hypothetical protein